MKFHQLLILPVALTALVSCTTIKTESTSSAKIKQGVPGGEVVQTTKIRATVTGIDAAKRKITLVTPDGQKLKVIAGPEVVNFAQIRIGDQLKVTLTEQLVIRMAKPGEKNQDGEAAFIGLAPVGAKPGAVSAGVYQATATVTAIDTKHHKATLKFTDGTSKNVTVRQDVDLTTRKVGEKVVIRTTEVLAVLIEKP
ncbi:MAG: hypothetical protein RLZZ282_986 [Verrucomicrobiota bacterium]|jgi:Cu/Ag efflux protein CusF